MPVTSREIENLAEEIMTDIELGKISLAAIMLKCARLARWLSDEQHRQIFAYEAGGYPTTPSGIPIEVFELGRAAGRVTLRKTSSGSISEKMSTASVDAWEQQVETNKTALPATADRNVSISSANPTQIVSAGFGNAMERKRLSDEIGENSKYLARSRAFAYEYANSALYQTRFSEAATTIFDSIRQRVDVAVLNVAPTAARKVASIQDNLASENPEDWANAVHSCRRLLQDVADAIFPPRENETRNGKSIRLGPDQYINRLVCYIEDNSESERFKEIVGSTLSFIGERLDAIFKAAQKGSHAEINSRAEAERYVVYTFLTIGDVLAL